MAVKLVSGLNGIAHQTEGGALWMLDKHGGKLENYQSSRKVSKVYWQENNMRTAPPRLETVQYRKSIWEKDVTYNNNAQWLAEPQQPPQTGYSITVANIPDRTDRFFHWYKQSLGKMVQTVATVVYKKIELISPFNHTRFHVHKSNDQCFLTINHINKEDEATYFCQTGSEFLQHFVRGFFLAVNDYNHQTSVYVTQTPKSSSVQLGNTVTLQCSFLTKNKESSAQCPSDRSVHWFKSGSGENHPSIIYRNFTHSNSMDDTERRCIYHLSKTIQNLSDTGTYYCAVATCGVLLFGEGSKVDTSKYVQSLIS
nr:uncharacterized protein LOC105940963 [Maylandia zebra]